MLGDVFLRAGIPVGYAYSTRLHCMTCNECPYTLLSMKFYKYLIIYLKLCLTNIKNVKIFSLGKEGHFSVPMNQSNMIFCMDVHLFLIGDLYKVRFIFYLN